MALQSKTITGKTSSSVWTWKIVVTEDNAVIATRKSTVTITEYLGRPSSAGGSYFQGTSNLKFEAGSSSHTQTYRATSKVNVGAGKWVKLASHTFEVDNLGSTNNPTTLSVKGSMSDANFSPDNASASGTIDLTPLHEPPIIELNSVEETNAYLPGVTGPVIVTNLSRKVFTFSYSTFENATIESVELFDSNVNPLSSDSMIDLSTFTVTVDLSNQTLSSNVISNNTTYFIIKVTDHLGGVATFTTPTYNIIPYSLPNLIATASSVKRNGQVSGKVNINLTGTFFNSEIGSTMNMPFLSFKYWASGTSEPTEYINIPSDAYTFSNDVLSTISMSSWLAMNGDTVITDVNKDSSYRFKIKIADNFSKNNNAPIEIELMCLKGEWVRAIYKDRVDFKKITVEQVDIMTYLFFKPGDTIVLPRIYTGGVISSSTEEVIVTIPIPKQIHNSITSIDILEGTLFGRTTTGGYLNGGTYDTAGIHVGDSGYTWSVSYFGENIVTIAVRKSSDYTNVDNNTPVGIQLENLTLQFNGEPAQISEEV